MANQTNTADQNICLTVGTFAFHAKFYPFRYSFIWHAIKHGPD